MKKISLALVAVISAIFMCFGIAACSSSVAGNTYKYDSFEINGEKSDFLNDMLKIYLAGCEITFNEDGTYVAKMFGEEKTAYYIQDGKTVFCYTSKEDAEEGDISKAEQTITVSGKKIKMFNDEMGYDMTIIFKKK